MRFLPIFLDLQSGPVLLLGAGELVRAKLPRKLSETIADGKATSARAKKKRPNKTKGKK